VTWQNATIGDVLEVIKNGINCVQSKEVVGNKITRIETIAQQKIDFERVGYSILSESDKDRSRIAAGDILFSHINSPIHVGKTAIYQGGEDLFHGINLLLLRTKKFISPYFFNYFLRYLFYSGYWARSCKQAVNQASVNQQDIKCVPFSYPNIELQEVIIDKLDAAFNEIDNAINALNAGMSNIESLYQQFLNDIFNACPNEWESVVLGDICSFDKKQGLHKGLPYIGMESIESSTGKYLGTLLAEEVKSSTFKFNSSHVLYGRLRPYLNKVLIPDFDGHCSTEIFPILVSKKIEKKFLFFWLIRQDTVNKINATCTGARMPRANMNEVLKFNISLPSIAIQKKLIVDMENFTQEVVKIKAAYLGKVKALNELKVAILNQEFAIENGSHI